MLNRNKSLDNDLVFNSPATLESLEPRLMLDAMPGFGDPGFTTNITKKYVFNDENDNKVVIKVANASATLTTSDDGYGEIRSLEVQPNNDKASITISSKDDINIGSIDIYGSMKTFNAPRADLNGDLSAQGWIQKLILSDVADGSQIQLYTDGTIELSPKITTSVTIDDAVNCNFSSGLVPVNKFVVDSFAGGSIEAQSFNNITSKGDFAADITALGANSKNISIGKFTADIADGSTIVAPAAVQAIKVDDWTGGSITAGSISTLQAGNRKAPAEFTADITLDGNLVDADKPVLNKLAITGQSHDATWDITGPVSVMSIGDASLVEITNVESLRNFSAGDVDALSLSVTNDAGKITADNIANSSIEAASANAITVKNDLTDSDLEFSLPLQDKGYTLNKLAVAAEMTDTTFSSQGSVNVISAARIVDSAILVGVDSTWTTDADADNVIDMVGDPADFNAPLDGDYAMINSLSVKGARGITDDLFVNSNISAGKIRKAYMANVDTDNNGDGFFGIMFKDSIDKFTYRQNNKNYIFGRDNWPNTQWFSVNDVDINANPAAIDDTVTTNEDTAITTANLMANDDDLNGDTIAIVSYTNPAHGTLTYNDDGTFDYTPDANYFGSDEFTYTLQDDQGGQATATVSITVASVNDAPVAADDEISLWEDYDEETNKTVFTANDTDVEGDSLTIISFSQAQHGTVSSTSTKLIYTPEANFNGTDSFTYTISDGNGGTDTATVNITVESRNDSPVGVDDSFTTDEDVPLIGISLVANDTDVDGDTLTIGNVLGDLPDHGTLVVNDDGTVDYTPDANFSGTDSFLYRPSDGTYVSNDWVTVTITVNDVNDIPVANDDQEYTQPNTPRTTNSVLTNDTDQDGDQLTVFNFTQPANGSVVYNDDGTFTYTPDQDFTGTDTFTYTVSDGNGGFDTATVSIGVELGNNHDPNVNDEAFTVVINQDYTTTSVLANDTDSDGHTLSVSSFTQPANGTVVYNGDGTFTYSLAEENFFVGNETFTYTVSDGNGGTAVGTVTITKPAITVDVLGAPQLDGADVDTLIVYRLRAFTNDSPDFTTFMVDQLTGVHQIWADVNTASAYSTSLAGLDADLSDFDTHMLVGPEMSLDSGETNDGSNPTGNDFGSVNAGLGTFYVSESVTNAASDLQFFQFVLPTNVSLTVSGTVYFEFDEAAFSIDIEATSDSGLNDAPVADNDTFSNIASNDAYTTGNVLTNDSDADNDMLTITDFTQPTHGTVVYNDNGTFTYTLNDYFTGDDTFTYTVSDGKGGTDTATVTINKPKITIDNLGAPVLNGTEIDSLVVYRIRATSLLGEDPFATFIINSVSGAHQIWADHLTPTIYNTMTGIDADLEDFDTHMLFGAAMSLSNAETNDATNPTGTNFGSVSAGLGSFEAEESTFNTDQSIEFFQIVLPTTTSLTLTGSAFQNITESTFSFDIVATDNGGVNTAPNAEDESFEVVYNQDYTTTNVLANDNDTDGDTLTITDFTQPTHGTVVYNNNGTFTYSLAEENMFAGSDTFTYTISDGNGGTDTATVTINKPRITVDVLGAPVLNGTAVTSLAVYRLRATAGDGEDIFETFMIDSLSNAHQIWADGSTQTIHNTMAGIDADLEDFDTHMLFAPVFSLNSGETNDGTNPTGNDFGGVTAGLGTFYAEESTNNADQSIQFFQLVVPITESMTITGAAFQHDMTETAIDIDITATMNPNNMAPVANDDASGEIQSNEPYTTANVLANDTDNDGDTLTVESFTQPSHGTVVYNDDGTFTYTLSEYFKGDDTFTYTVSDGNGGTNTATFTITKPEITYDVLGSPSLDGTDVPGLKVYRLRCTAADGEDYFDSFQIAELANTHQVWSGQASDTVRLDPGVLDNDWLDFDTHMLVSSADSPLSIQLTETNDSTNPSGLTFDNGTITGTAGMGTFKVGALGLTAGPAQSYQFMQIVIQNTDTVTVHGVAAQDIEGEAFEITLNAN